MAAPAEQPELTLQGNLFGEPTAAAAAPIAAEAAPEADAPARPRRRRTAANPEPATAEPSPASPDNDLPAWHHHSLVDPQQLTPMLRHYVELKAAHPERVLLYRLGDFFECFFEDAI